MKSPILICSFNQNTWDKMKKPVFFLSLLVLITSYLNAETSLNLKETQPVLVAAQELQRLNSLIAITEKNLENQKALKQLFSTYQQKQINYLSDPENKELTLQMVTSAHRLLEGIRTAHLIQAFDAEFISQLTFFSQFATKPGIPKT